jgi:hypothetical protein
MTSWVRKKRDGVAAQHLGGLNRSETIASLVEFLACLGELPTRLSKILEHFPPLLLQSAHSGLKVHLVIRSVFGIIEPEGFFPIHKPKTTWVICVGSTPLLRKKRNMKIRW